MKKQTFIVSIICYITLILYSIFGEKFFGNAGNDYQIKMIKSNSISMMLFIFIFGALAETAIFNFAFVYYLKTTKYFSNKDFLIVIIVSLLFGLAHFSSVNFVIITFFAGLILNANFIYYVKKYNKYGFAFLSTFLIHLLSNLTVYFIDINT